MSEEHWIDVAPMESLSPGVLKTVKLEGHQWVVGKTSDGDAFVLDNRCPHEGYPLAQGTLDGCRLTCCWHNWKFDVRDGSCLLGGEGVRRYPSRVQDGQLQADVREPAPETVHPRLLESLREGLFRYENGRAVRDSIRLVLSGFDPHRLLGEIARYDALHAEYGTTHALAVAADCGRLVEERTGTEVVYAIAPAIDQCGDTNRRLPRRPVAEAKEGGSLAELMKAVENERAEDAEALFRGRLDGRSRKDIEQDLFQIFASHFTDFGHQLIYLIKGSELLDRIDDDSLTADLYTALLHSFILATREDTLPYMRPYYSRLEGLKRTADEPGSREDGSPKFVEALTSGSIEEACRSLEEALEAGHSLRALAKDLAGVAAQRFARFDIAIDEQPDVAENWLWVTHRFTFSSAVRNAIARCDPTSGLRYLIQAVAFVHSGRSMDGPLPVLAPQPGDVDDVLGAIEQKNPERALAVASHMLDNGRDAELRRALEQLCLQDPLVRPIVATHAIKSTVAAFEEYQALEGHPLRDWTVLAVVRFVASPIRERRLHQQVMTSIQWVQEGKMPRKLTQ